MSSSGAQMSSRPPPKPKVSKPMSSSAQLPAKIRRSAQEIAAPYLLLDRPEQPAGLVEVPVVGPAVERREALRAGAAAAAPVGDAVRAGGVPGHPDEQRAVVAVVRRPPLLRGRHHLDDVPLQGLEVEARERLDVVEVLVQRVRQGRVLVQHLQVQLVRPPIPIRPARGRIREDGVFTLAAAVRHWLAPISQLASMDGLPPGGGVGRVRAHRRRAARRPRARADGPGTRDPGRERRGRPTPGREVHGTLAQDGRVVVQRCLLGPVEPTPTAGGVSRMDSYQVTPRGARVRLHQSGHRRLDPGHVGRLGHGSPGGIRHHARLPAHRGHVLGPPGRPRTPSSAAAIVSIVATSA